MSSANAFNLIQSEIVSFGKVLNHFADIISNITVGSEEELEAIKEAYVRFEGRMEEILSHVMCAEVEDEDRISDIIKKLIKKKEVPEFKVFSKEFKKTKEARKRKVS